MAINLDHVTEQIQVTDVATNASLTVQPKGTGAFNVAAGSSGLNISNGGTVTAITRTANGSGYTGIPSVAISAPTTAGGVQATATASVFGNTATVVSGGAGYTLNDVVTLAGGAPVGLGATYTVTGVSGGVVTTVSPLNFQAYTAVPANPVSVTGGTGSGLTLTVTYGYQGATITNAGSGYVEQPTVTFSGGGGSGAAAYATVGSGTTFKTIGTSLSFSGPAGEVLRLNGNVPNGTLTDYAQIDGGVSGVTNGVYLRANGSSTNQALYVQAKGTSAISFFTNWVVGSAQQFTVTHTASAVNFVQVTGAATGGAPTISSQGSDANARLVLNSKGSSSGIDLLMNNSRQVFIGANGSAVNYLQLGGSAAGSAPVLSVQGSDTNIDLALTPKGTGNVRFGTYTGTALSIAGYIEIKDAGGTIRRLAVVA